MADEPNETDPLFVAPEGPHAFIQWKNTDACLEIYCECGAQGHIDDYFCYAVQCRNCGKIWRVGMYVTLYPDRPGEESAVEPKLFGDGGAEPYCASKPTIARPIGFDAIGKVVFSPPEG